MTLKITFKPNLDSSIFLAIIIWIEFTIITSGMIKEYDFSDSAFKLFIWIIILTVLGVIGFNKPSLATLAANLLKIVFDPRLDNSQKLEAVKLSIQDLVGIALSLSYAISQPATEKTTTANSTTTSPPEVESPSLLENALNEVKEVVKEVSNNPPNQQAGEDQTNAQP